MAAYKDLVGQKITVVTSNPPEPKTGQMWYNSTDGVLRGLGVVEAFVSQTNMPTTIGYHTSFGQAAPTTVSAGGIGSPGPAPTSAVFEFNGSGWTVGGAIPSSGKESARGFGTQTAGVIVGGSPGANPDGSTTTSHYNGSSWTSGGALPTAVQGAHTWGTQTAGFLTGGRGNGPPFPRESASYTYNGSAWATSTAMPEGRQFGGSSSTSPQTSALVFSGQTPPGRTNSSIEWNGSAWTSTPNVTYTADQLSGSGIATAALAASGSAPSVTGSSSKYDGSSWTAGATLSTARSSTSGQGATGVTSVIFGGLTPSYTSAVEEYSFSTNTVTAAAWAAGGNLNTGRNAGSGFGIQTAAVMTTGNEPGETNKTEHYDGTSWTNATNYPISKRFTTSCGTLTSGLVAGGSPDVATVNKYDGTNWTAANSIPTATNGGTMFGTQTASVFSVGRNPSVTTNTYEFDGTNWTAGGAAGTGRYFLDSSGTSTAGLMFGGQTSGPTIRSETEEYDGTSWSESGDLGTARYGVGGSSAGTQTDTIAFAGNSPAIVLTEGYDGTVWSTRPNMATARRFISGAGTATLGIGFGGNPPNNSTEEFTGETETANVTDFSTE